jgi:hypothetical protein
MADALRDTIIDPADLVFYDEARACLDGGSYRAAYIMSWIAAAEGILGKLRAMAALNDALGTFVDRFETAQRAGMAKDAELIDQAFSMGLIDDPERISLGAMRDLRNQYGHPTSASPSLASAEEGLRVAVSSVLAKPALIMHGAARQLAARAETDRHLVPPDMTAVDAFIKLRAPVIHEQARPLFIRELFAGAERQIRDANGETLADRCLRMARVALTVWGEALNPPRWNIDRLRGDSPVAAADVLSDANIWPLLGQEDQDSVLSLCLDEATGSVFTRNPARLLACADQLSAAGLLTPGQQQRLSAALNQTEPSRLLRSGVRYEHIADAIIRELDDGLFSVATHGVELLRASDREMIEGLDKQVQYQIGLGLAYAANQNTWAAINEMQAMSNNANSWPFSLREGVVVGGLTGRWNALYHEGTSEAAFRLALSDVTGELARAAVESLTEEKTQGMPLPKLVAKLRGLVAQASPGPAVSRLTEFLDRVEARPESAPGVRLRDFG